MHSPPVANKGNKKVKLSHNSNCSYRKMTKKEEERSEKRKEDAFCKAKRKRVAQSHEHRKKHVMIF